MKVKRLRRPLTKTARTLCIGGAVIGAATAGALADDAATVEELKSRVSALEALLQKEGVLPATKSVKQYISAASGIDVSGFATASYFYDTSCPGDDSSNAYLWNRNSGDFTINKFKLVLASKPAEASGDKWDAAFRGSLIWGEDAPVVNTGNYSQSVSNTSGSVASVKSGSSSGFEALREAYVEINVPIGTGLNVRAGQLISLLNWESGDGGSANPNFSQGNQWFYTGNGPSAGVQLGYAFTDKVSAKVRLQNGMYAGPLDGNDAKTAMGSLNFKPNDKLWFNLIGFGGEESDTLDVLGFSILAGYQFTEKFGSGYEFDYFNFDGPAADDDVLWSIGGWFWYDFTSKVGLALRAEYLNDDNGFGTGGLLGFPGNTGGDIYGVTLTLNYKPLPNLKIQPEIRFDGTTVDNGFDGDKCRVIVGTGISYMF